MITIDFETYSAAGLPGFKNKSGIALVGAAAYAQHPSTRILMLAYNLHDGQPTQIWTPGDPDPEELLKRVELGETVEAHNVMFEYWIWKHNKPESWPELKLEQLADSMVKVKEAGLPAALGNISSAMSLPFDKMTEGKRLIQKFSMPGNEQVDLFSEDWKLFKEYCKRDVDVEMFVSSAVPDLHPFEARIAKADRAINDRGVYIDRPAVEAMIYAYEQELAEGNSRLRQITAGLVRTVRETSKLADWLATRGVSLPRTDKGSSRTDKKALQKIETDDPEVLEVLKIREKLSLASVDKLYAFRYTSCGDGRIRGLFNFYGARTGRWTASGIQPQNMPSGMVDDIESTLSRFKRGDFGDNITADISGSIRGLLRAAPGKDFISSDYSAIEARVLAELAGEDWRREVFKTHGKIYETSASKITGTPFSQITKDHPERKLGKVAELASGYGGWINAWKAFGADKFFNNDEEIKRSILKWREESPKIVDFWGGQFKYGRPFLYGLEGAVIQAILNPHKREVVNSYISFEYDGNNLYCYLPSGRRITYRDAHLQDVNYYGKPKKAIKYKSWSWNPVGWRTFELYGGLIAENVTQAVSRDLLAHAICELEDAGYPVVLHIHDEIVVEVPEGFGSIEEVEAIMGNSPSWASGWSIVASGGWRGKRFRK